jgi:flagellar biosynthetic protein FliR
MTAGGVVAQELSRLHLDLFIPLLALVMARILPVLLLSPVAGGEVVPAQVKMGLGLILALVMFPAVSPQARAVQPGSVLYVVLLVKEVMVGFCLAMLASTVFEAARVAGAVVDQIIGNISSQLELPEEHQAAPLLGNLHFQLAVALFLTFGGHRWVVDSLGTSFTLIPLDRFPSFRPDLDGVAGLLLRAFGDLFRIGLTLSAPPLVASLLADVTLGLVNRVAPQIQLFFLSLALKPLVALVLLLLALPFVLDRIQNEFGTWLARLGRAVAHFS